MKPEPEVAKSKQATTDLGKPLVEPTPPTPKEGELGKKVVIKIATLVLHDIRPQPRAIEIEGVLDQLRVSEDTFTDAAAVKAKAEELLKKARPEEAPAGAKAA